MHSRRRGSYPLVVGAIFSSGAKWPSRTQATGTIVAGRGTSTLPTSRVDTSRQGDNSAALEYHLVQKISSDPDGSICHIV
jgi:hypothetical protein